jgi:hypothetical protein
VPPNTTAAGFLVQTPEADFAIHADPAAESHTARTTNAKDVYIAVLYMTTAAGLPADLAAESQAAGATLTKDLYIAVPSKTTAAGFLVQTPDADSAIPIA